MTTPASTPLPKFHPQSWKSSLSELTKATSARLDALGQARDDTTWAAAREAQLVAERRSRLGPNDRVSEAEIRQRVRGTLETEKFQRITGAFEDARAEVVALGTFLHESQRQVRRLRLEEPRLDEEARVFIGSNAPVVEELRRVEHQLSLDRWERKVTGLSPTQLWETLRDTDPKAEATKAFVLEAALEAALASAPPAPKDAENLTAWRAAKQERDTIRAELDMLQNERLSADDREHLSAIEKRLREFESALRPTALLLTAARTQGAERLPVEVKAA